MCNARRKEKMKTITKIERKTPILIKKKRVAAYARVSMETDRLNHSLSQQISFYNNLIQKNPEWEFAGVFADNGISGTATSKRMQFNKMIEETKKGNIDIILTKSISRFAKNTLDLLNVVRELKELGVEIRFEKENINTLTGDGELMLSILASFAQEESRSISDNVKWGTRKRFEKGIPNGHFIIYGYKWIDDKLVIVPEEAKVVKKIFKNFLDGKSRLETEREFRENGIKTRLGCKWKDSNIKGVLCNITYTGNMLFQKEFIEDPITKHRKKNKGELPQYYVKNTHEAIIDKKTFDYVQEEMKRRRELGALANKSLNISCFTGKIKCPSCHQSYIHNMRKDRGFGDNEFWSCGSRKKKGGHCEIGGSINAVELKRWCCKVLNLKEFDEDIFLREVNFINVPKRYVLEFHLKKGRVETIECNSHQKKEMRTPERKKLWNEYTLKYKPNEKTNHRAIGFNEYLKMRGINYAKTNN